MGEGVSDWQKVFRGENIAVLPCPTFCKSGENNCLGGGDEERGQSPLSSLSRSRAGPAGQAGPPRQRQGARVCSVKSRKGRGSRDGTRSSSRGKSRRGCCALSSAARARDFLLSHKRHRSCSCHNCSGRENTGAAGSVTANIPLLTRG